MIILGEQYCKYCFAAGVSEDQCTCKQEAERHPAALPISTVLKNRYVVGMILGKGGFGITYLCFDSVQKCRVAIKEFYPSALVSRVGMENPNVVYNSDDKESILYGLKKFEDEARMLNKLQNVEDIVDVYDYFKENNTAYVVMEYLDGIDLKKYIDKCGGRISPEESAYILVRVTGALEFIHSNSIYHRDIAPDNIHILPDGSVKLMDFGAAKQIVGMQTGSMSVVFKKGFTPPEQYQSSENPGPWTDIYALGATVYYALTGDIPEEALSRYTNDTLDLSDKKGIPSKFKPILEKAMAVSREERYKTASELKNAVYEANLTCLAPVVERSVPESKYQTGFISSVDYDVSADVADISGKTEKKTVYEQPPVRKKKNILLIIAVVCLAIALIAASVVLIIKLADKGNDTVSSSGGSSGTSEYLSEYPNVKKDENGVVMYSVKIDPAGGTYSDEACVYLYDGEEITLKNPTPPKAKRVFFNVKGEVQTVESAFEFSHWMIQNERSDSGKIKINGTAVKAKAVYEQIPVVLPEVNQEGLTFIGWYTQLSGGKFVGFSSDTFTPVNDITLYACFETPDDDPSLDENAMYYETEYYGNENSVAITKYIGNEKNVTIPSVINGRNVVALLDGVFLSNTGVETVVIPEGVKQIGENCFNNCSHLKSVVLPDSLEKIGNFAFYRCMLLENISIGEDLSEIGNSVFGECYALSSFTVSDKNGAYSSLDGVLYNKQRTKLYCYPANKADIAFEMPDTVQYVEESAFYACKKLVSVTFPSSLIGVGKMSFYYCNSLTDIQLPDGVVSIGSRAFTNCTSLKTVRIPKTVTTFGDGIFNGSENITAIYTPTDSPAFKWCNDNGYGDILNEI